MRGRILKKSLVIMLLITMLLADFLVLGMNIVSYAIELISTTNHDNVNFTAYFKNAEGQKVYSLEQATNSEDIRLYMDVTVSKEGYFNGKVELGNANFVIKDVVQNNAISKVENNSIYLNQINSGESAQIEVIVEPKVEEKIDLSLLNMESSLNISGTYVYGEQKEAEIKAERKVNLVLTNPATEIDYKAEVITNKIYEVEGTNKRIVQLLVESKLNGNAYPVKNTNIEINVPTNVEDVKVTSRGTLATDGKQSHEFIQDNWEYKKEENKLNISLENTAQDGKINWAQNASDKLIVTFVFAETEDVANLEITSKAEVELYNSEATKISKDATVKLSEELDGVISIENSSNEEIYKGKLYTSEERIYITNTKININFENVTQKIIVEENTKYEDGELNVISSNIEYKTTIINKELLFSILGENGYLKILDTNGTQIANITKETEANEQGEIVINYNGTTDIKIEISMPEVCGTIELKHEKAIKENLDREIIKQIKNINETSEVSYETAERTVKIGKVENKIELKETTSVATLEINKEKLSTVAVNEDVEIKVILLTNNEKYDLYKNPTLEIQLPEIIEKVKFTSVSKAYCDELKIEKAQYREEEKKILISFSEEQTKYEEYESIEGPTIILKADITLDEKAVSQDSKISLKYSNEKTNSLVNDGNIEKTIQVEAPSRMLAFNTLSNYNINMISGISEDKEIVNISEEKNNIAEYEIGLVNNSKNDATNVKILGNFPTEAKLNFGDEQVESTVKTSVRDAISSIEGNGTVYYSENENADRDIEKAENGWTTDINSISEPKVYLIQIERLNKGEKFTAQYAMNLPENVEYNKVAYTTFNVTYKEISENVTSRGSYTRTNESGEVEVQANLLGLSTGIGPILETTVTTSVNGETIENNEKVYEKEVIMYTIKIENSGEGDAEGVKINGSIPEGTTYIESDGGQIIEGNCVITTDIPAGETVTKTYSVKVNEGIEDGKSTTNKIYVDEEEKSSITHILKKEDKSITVSVENTEDVEELEAGELYNYKITIQNNTAVDLDNLVTNILVSPYLDIWEIKYIDENGKEKILQDTSTVNIQNLKANSSKELYVLLMAREGLTSLQDTYIYTEVECNEIIYKSAKLNENIRTKLIETTLTSNKLNKYIYVGDEIEFTITTKNKSDIKYDNLTVINKISDGLTIVSVEKNGVTISNPTITKENFLNISLNLDVQEIATIKIKARVDKVKDQHELGNTVELLVNGENNYVGTVFSICLEEKKEEKESIRISISTDTEEGGNQEGGDQEGGNQEGGNQEGGNQEGGNNQDGQPEEKTTSVSGIAWLDVNENGKIDEKEEKLKNIVVKLFNLKDNKVQQNSKNEDISTKTDKDGKYILSDIPSGEYLVIFEYDIAEYKLTTYRAENVDDVENSDVIAKAIKINGKEENVASTDKLEIKSNNIENINMGLVEIQVFDLVLNKYISKVVVTNSEGTKTTEYDKETLGKVEIKSKLLNETTVVVEYTIEVKNVGEVNGTVKSIVDYLPTSFDFSTELNKDWYKYDSNIYNNSLANEEIKPGESKVVKLVLTKKITENNIGLINNTAELSEVYNEKGLSDINSTPTNKNQKENDLGSADLIIAVSTGGIITYIALSISMLAIIAVGAYFINKKILRVKF